MEEKEFQTALAEMKTALETKAKADAKLEVTEQLKAIEDANTASKGQTADQLKKISDDLAITVKAFDLFQLSVKKDLRATGRGEAKSFGMELGEKLNERMDDLKSFKGTKKGFGSIELESKAVGIMASGTSFTGTYFVAPMVLPGVNVKPYETIHMRDLLPVGQTTSNAVRYVRDNGGEGGPGMVAEAGLKPQIDRDLQILDAPVRKIATYFRVPEEMIDDVEYLQSFLVQIGLEEVMIVEDAQIIYGDGTAQNLSGLFTNATAFAAGPSVVVDPNRFDVLLAAKKQGRVAKTNPTVALISPEDMYSLKTKKDTSNNYLFLGGGNGIDVNGVLNVSGLRIVEHTAVTSGDFLVFDPRNAMIVDRAGTTVRFYDQDQDNAIKNLITIVIEKRLALPIMRTDGIIKGTFATAITDLGVL